MNFNFDRFNLDKVLYEEGCKVVCAARRIEDNAKVILKIVTAENSTLTDILRLRNEYQLIKDLDFQGMVKVIDLRDASQGVAMVMEYFDGKDLKDYLTENEVGISDFLIIANQLASILKELHSRRIIHKDIKPSNILIHPITKEIRLIDFGIAISITQENVANISHHDFEGSLHYISPEQTGRMNRILDYRTDFYSAGILFYEILTRKKPFDSLDAIELLHAHLAKQPPLISAGLKAVPEVLENIVFKLLEKSPENRYQNALGLKSDLDECIRQFNLHHSITSFPLAQKDLSDQFLVAQKLYGREKEVAALIDAFEGVSQGVPALMLVSGYSGIGKSALVRELHLPIIARKGYFTSGKYDQFKRDIPYSAIIEAFSRIIQAILSENDKTIAHWKEKFIDAVGTNGQIIINVIPQIELIIGKQPPAIELPVTEAQNRFNYVFLMFAQIIGSKEHPLVFFVDDLQWADLPSLNLIELLLTEKTNNYLLIIGSYRSNEVAAMHPLLKTITNLETTHCVIKKIELAPLHLADIHHLIADSLHRPIEECFSLGQLIQEKTGGNPFFVIEFLKALAGDKLIVFDYSANQWQWNLEKIKLRNITDNVVELMSGKIKLLHVKAQTLCQYAACIGSRFDLITLSAIYRQTPAKTASDLWPAIQEGLILPIKNNYRLAENLHSGDAVSEIEYKFLHDQVQEAAYALMNESEKQKIHHQIGTLLLDDFNKKENKSKIFNIVNQLNRSLPLIQDAPSRIHLSILNLTAGKKAKEAAAYAPAAIYLNTGREILPDTAWSSHYDHTLELYNESAEAAYLISDPIEMERIISAILTRTTSLLDRVKAYIIKAQAYVSMTRNEDALNTCMDILEQLGVHLPSRPNKLHIISSLMMTKYILWGKSKDHLLSLPLMNDAKQSATIEILSTAASPAYFAKPDLFPLIVFKQIQLAVKYGNHMHTGFTYSTYGLIMCGSTHEFDEGQKYGQLAVGLLEKFNANNLFAKIHFLNAFFIRIWKLHYKDTIEELLSAVHKGLETGDFLFASYAAFNIQAVGFYIGRPLSELSKQMEESAKALEKIKQYLGLGWLNIYKESVKNLLDSSQNSTTLFDTEENEKLVIENHTIGKDYSGLCVFYLNKMMLSYWFEKPLDAINHGAASMKLIESVLGGGHVPIIHFYYALSLLRVAGDDPKRKDCIKKSLEHIRNMKMWAKTSPSNHRSKQYILEGELYRVRGNTPRAISSFLQGIHESIAHQNYVEEAMANELLGRLYFKLKEDEKAKKYMLQARMLYIRWGAIAKVNLLNETFVLLRDTIIPGEKISKGIVKTSSINKSLRSMSDELDMATINKASLAISGEIVLDKLMIQLMKILLENEGAQRGYLILSRDNEWYIEVHNSELNKAEEKYTSIPLEDNPLIPETIVHYVIRTKEDIVIDNLLTDQKFYRSTSTIQPISVLCLPIIHQGTLIAVLYVDNLLHRGVFTNNRIQFLKLLSGQIAVSLQNALLFESLEHKVIERTQQLTSEKKKSDDLLLNILPAEVAEELKHQGTSEARQYEDVTVLFTDFVDFTQISEKLSPKELVLELDTCFKAFDKIMGHHGLEKIKTIGDSYMAVSGLPISDKNHAQKAVDAAFEIREYLHASSSPFAGVDAQGIRIGLHSGTVVAGIVGNKKFAYDIWGDTVNVANRMESSGEPGKINISGTTYEHIKGLYQTYYRGKIKAKNKGEIDMYFVE